MTAINDEREYKFKPSYPWWHHKLYKLAAQNSVQLETYKYYYLPYYLAGFTPEKTIKGLSNA